MKYSHRWRRIGEELGFKHHELENYLHRPFLAPDAPNSYLRTMLADWKEWARGDDRGSTTYASLHSLRRAVEKAGLGLIAQEL